MTTALCRCRATLACLVLGASVARAQRVPDESGYDLWLRYVAVDDTALRRDYAAHATQVIVPNTSPTMRAARDELQRGLRGLLGARVPFASDVTADGALVVATPALVARLGWAREVNALGAEGFVVRSARVGGRRATVIASRTDVGALYGVFRFLRLLQTARPIDALRVAERPRYARRVLDHWDNLDGTIERGYAGASIWKWDELPARVDARLIDYARADASVGINGVVLNNVNADPRVLRADHLAKVAAIASALRPYGVRVYLSANFGAPLAPSATPAAAKKAGGIGTLATADPLDPAVRHWWKAKADEIYKLIPDFGGFLVKANSEGMPGPQDYDRTHADGANMLAAALAPHGGVVMWRAFVYPKNADTDRVKRAYKEFVPLDGTFASNVLVQAKNGPLDFQPREPFNPLFGAMPHTPLMAEVQITQEYLGQSTHLVYLAPMWKEFLDVARDDVRGIAGVANVGADSDWTGHHFAQANWYAYGRLAWDPTLSADAIAEEWTRMTWGNAPRVVRTIESMMRGSWEAAVNVFTPLGLALTVDGAHYEPGLERRQGEYWFADAQGIGYDRTTGGSDYASQYPEPWRSRWNDPATTPPELLLWFHRVPWDHTLADGRTVWDELVRRYDDGARYSDSLLVAWRSLAGDVDARRWREVETRLERQRAHAARWRDASVAYFRCRREGTARCGS